MNKGMNNSDDNIKARKVNENKPFKSKFHKLESKISLDPSPLDIPEIQKYRKEVLDLTPVAEDCFTPKYSEGSDEMDVSCNSINDEIDFEMKKPIERYVT